MSNPSDYAAEKHQLAQKLGYPEQPQAPQPKEDES